MVGRRDIQRADNARAQDVTDFENPAAQWGYLSRMALNRYRDWLRHQREISIEDLANRIFPEATGDSEAIDLLTTKQMHYRHLE